MTVIEQQDSGGAPGPFARKSRYILVVEENTNELFTTAMLLHRFSYPVCTARNGRQALDMVSVAVPSLVVSDFSLSGMNGLDLLRVLGSTDRTFSIPFIILTPPAGAGSEHLAVEIGGANYLQKPVQVEALYRAVQAVMEPTPRTNIRVQTALPVTVNRSPLDIVRGECATHLSSQGMYIRTFKYHQRGEQIALQMAVEGRTISADATILYTRRFDDGPFMEPGMAVKFTRITGEDREFLRSYIRSEVTQGIVAEAS
jgi:CheY-like chemotaxis protein